MLHRLAFLLKTSPTHSKMLEYDQIKKLIFGLEDAATKPVKRKKKARKTINCHYPDIP
jgi:hypothetical protein